MKAHRGPLKGGGKVEVKAVQCFYCGLHTDPANKAQVSDSLVTHACENHPIREMGEHTLLWSNEVTDPDVLCEMEPPGWEPPPLPPHLEKTKNDQCGNYFLCDRASVERKRKLLDLVNKIVGV